MERENTTTITIEGVYEGYVITVTFHGRVEQVPEAVQRLQAMGVQPVPAATVSKGETDASAERSDRADLPSPSFTPDGVPCCPIHQREMRQGRWGWYCPAKDGDAFCSFTWKPKKAKKGETA